MKTLYSHLGASLGGVALALVLFLVFEGVLSVFEWSLQSEWRWIIALELVAVSLTVFNFGVYADRHDRTRRERA